MRKIVLCLAGLLFITGCVTIGKKPVSTSATGTGTVTVAAVPTPVATNTPPAAPAPANPPPPALPAITPAAAEKPATPPAPQPAVQPAPPPETKIKHAAIGAAVTVSSTSKKYPTELPPSVLVDGDLTTRWSSEYAEPQTIEVKLEKPMKLAKIRLHWEDAVATKYSLSVSSDGKSWNGMYAFMKTDAKPVPRVDDIALNGVSAGFIKLDLTGRVSPEWGFSLYEIEVIPAE